MTAQANTDLMIGSGEEMNRLLFHPEAMNALRQLASDMANATVTVPQHFRGKEGDCMAVAMQAAQWRMNPYAVAQKTHVTQGGQLGYEAQLVNSVVNSIAPIKNRIEFEFIGDWNKILGKVAERTGNGGGKYYVAAWNKADEEGLGVRAWATLKGEDYPREITVMLSQCYPRFSTQWATDPQQQITYVAVKKWARRYCPDVILGVYTPDELEQPQERDVTPPPEQRREEPEPREYPDERFERKFPEWRDMIANGHKTADDIVATLRSRHIKLTDAQLQQLQDVEPPVEGEIVDDGQESTETQPEGAEQ